MKVLLIALLTAICEVSFADESLFIKAYDAGDFDAAAKQLDGLDVTNAGIARRLGVMYYNARGVDGDQAKGRALLEQSMIAGDATAAVNLAKIYFKIEKNSPKAAWCLMVAEGLNDASVKDDVAKLRGYLGDDYFNGVTSYIAQLRDLLASEETAFKNKTGEFDRERTSLTGQIASSRGEFEKLVAVRDELAKKLAAAEETMVADKQKIEELAAENKELKSTQIDLKRSAQEQSDARASLEDRLRTTETDMESARNDIAECKRIIKTMEEKPLDRDADTEKIASSQIYKRYNQLVEKYNVLVRKYNRLLEASHTPDQKTK